VGRLVALTLLVAPATGAAQGTGADAAAAEALYRDGSAEMEAGKYDSACPKLEESFRLDPATGALLTLAACLERSGKVASAWVRYLDVEARAQRENDKDRATVAHDKAAQLAPRLPRLRVVLSDHVLSLPGIEVKRDGTPIAVATLSSALPVDPGSHVVEISASGHAPARRDVTLAEGRTDEVRVDELAIVDAVAPPPATEPPPPTDDGGLSSVQIGGIVVGGAGLAALGVGFAFGAIASGRTTDLEDDFGYRASDGACTRGDAAACQAAYDDAKSAATLSTVLVIGGSVLTAAGVVMVLVGGEDRSDDARVEVVPGLAGATLRGRL
jgi:hypothetical protein